jgi:hypothetical protein
MLWLKKKVRRPNSDDLFPAFEKHGFVCKEF